MGLERPDGPYAAEMTAGAAWPDVDETALLDAADAFAADSEAVDAQLWVFQQARNRLFDDEAWSGQAADAAHAKHRQVIDRVQSQVRGSAAAAKLYRDCASATIYTKQQITTNVENAQQEIAQVANHPTATADQKDTFIKGLIRAAHAENVELVQSGAARLGKPPTTPLTVRPASNGHEVPLAPPTDRNEPTPDRKHNQEEAFKQVYGHAPTSGSDWEMAAALDPHTYNPDFKGTPSEVRVVRINPVPGQGVVRSSQWIPQRDVTGYPPPSRDLGNNRGPDAHFDPENTKVTTYIDYEHGVVVMRQNPSVEMNADGSPGQVKVGGPQGSVTQTPDGAVRIRYDAGNPLAPGWTTDPSGPFGTHRESVNGDLVFTPGPGGVHVDGTRTNYPSMEIYQDMPNGTTHTVLIDPAQSGSSTGPALNLPLHHEIGIGGRAFEPFDKGGWNPRYDVPTPLPSTPFGPVTAPPSVPPPPSGGGVWA